MAADPVPYDGSCDECDLCCVLAKQEVDDCNQLYWLCTCPGGVLSLQKGPGWVDSDLPFDPVDSVLFLYDNESTAGTYRLKCTLANDQVYYSNSVTPSVGINWCKCSDGTSIETTRVWFDVEVRPFTRASFGDNRAYGTAVGYSTYIDCPTNQDGLTRVELVSFGANSKLWAMFRTPVGTVAAKWDASVWLGTASDLFPGGSSQDLIVEKLTSSLVQGYECYWECFTDLAFDGSALGWPDKDTVVSGQMTRCVTQSGSFPNTYCSDGDAVIVREIQIEIA